MTSQIQKLKLQIVPILKNAGVIRSGVFGSFARGEELPNSDLDLLVELGAGKTFLDLAELKINLEDALGRKVDIVTYRSLSPRLEKTILTDHKSIL